jgi:phage terminase large subunit-like protein
LDFATLGLEFVMLSKATRRVRLRHRLMHYLPYPKQLAFHDAGARYGERLLMAANQVGKSTASAAEAALHLTGRYDDWEQATGMRWRGRRFDRPVTGWVGCDTWPNTRDGLQRLLVGPPNIEEEWGSGLIPGDDLVGCARRQGAAHCLDGVVVQHWKNVAPPGAPPDLHKDGLSTLGFKSYDQGRAKWQGATLDFVGFDEEPDEEIYNEGKTRVNATGGIVWLAFTPLRGMSAVVHSFKDADGDRF